MIQGSKKTSAGQQEDHVEYADITAESSNIDVALTVKQEAVINQDDQEANSVNTSAANCFYMNYPASVVDHETSMSFVYDTTNVFSNESMLDFWGESLSLNYSRSNNIGAFESFGSVDNLSLDDYY